MPDEDFYSHITECVCTNPTHGGKLWLCDTELCELNKEKDHPNTCRCETCRYWGN